MQRAGTADLCFAYARAQPWLAGIVVGAETAGQLAENIALFRNPPLTAEQKRWVNAKLPSQIPEQLLNPALWAKH